MKVVAVILVVCLALATVSSYPWDEYKKPSSAWWGNNGYNKPSAWGWGNDYNKRSGSAWGWGNDYGRRSGSAWGWGDKYNRAGSAWGWGDNYNKPSTWSGSSYKPAARNWS